MHISLSTLLSNTLYLLAVLNPVSKVLFLSAYEPPLKQREITQLSWRASLAAFLILLLVSAAGELILGRVFHISIYSLRVTGGLILFAIGWIAIREGRFSDRKMHQNFLPENLTEISLVPLAAPLIAGPGTITVCISGTAEHGFTLITLALALALTVNFLLMLFSSPINRVLGRLHLRGPLIRLTGLVIAATAMQMVLDGLRQAWPVLEGP